MRAVDAAVERTPLDEMPVLDRPYLRLASFYTGAGRVERARQLPDEYLANTPPERQRNTGELAGAEGVVAIAEGRFGDAIRLTTRAYEAVGCGLCHLPDLARAYDGAGDAAAALATWERFLTSPSLERSWVDPLWRGTAMLRVAQLHEDAGNVDDARRWYARFVELWEHADPALQPRVDAARARLTRLMPG